MLKSWPDLYAFPFRDPLGNLNILTENYLSKCDLFSFLVETLWESVTIQLAYPSFHYIDLSAGYFDAF